MGKNKDVENFGQVKMIFGSDDAANPRCPHGPSLLMEREDKRFYACSAYRNRRDCDFYHPAGEKLGQAKQFRMSQAGKALVAGKGHRQMLEGVRRGLEEGGGVVQFCQRCGGVGRALLAEGPQCCSQAELTSVTREEASRPSSILQPKARDKKEAQYFFSSATSSFLASTVTKLGFTDVLCVGCPSVMELLPENLNTLLLDLDPRFQSFYPPDKFVWYNFFNGHCFNGDQPKTVLQNFLIGAEKLLIILDPPFGAKTELIGHSLDRIREQVEQLSFSARVSVAWVFPYFMEKQVLSCSPSLSMSDYRVTYSNHKEFSGSGRKQGSPVRLYTCLPLAQLELPQAEGYRRCQPCGRWVAKENVHCDLCKACPSKDGRTYVHCSPCGRCVKPTYSHCQGCGRCKLPTHSCSAKEQEKGAQEQERPAKRKKLGKAKNMSIAYKKKFKKK